MPRLTSWLEVRVPGTYWLELVRADHRWEPAERLAMPLHHATRLELTNLGGVPALADGGPDRVRVTVELTARDVQHDERRATWFVTYRARILDACPAGG